MFIPFDHIRYKNNENVKPATNSQTSRSNVRYILHKKTDYRTAKSQSVNDYVYQGSEVT